MRKQKKIKIRTLLAALKKNGLPWTRNSMYASTVDGAKYCALGQTAYNLGYDPRYGDEVAWRIHDHLMFKYDIDIINFNDSVAQSYKDVVVWAERKLEAHLDEYISFEVPS